VRDVSLNLLLKGHFTAESRFQDLCKRQQEKRVKCENGIEKLEGFVEINVCFLNICIILSHLSLRNTFFDKDSLYFFIFR
jgi:hypothetical protein